MRSKRFRKITVLSLPVPDFISNQEQDFLLSKIDQHSWLTDLKRRVQHYGYKYDYKARTVGNDAYLGPLPDWLASLSKKPYDDGIFPSVPKNAALNLTPQRNSRICLKVPL